ncbi:MAG TPA: GMC family oxidoreductase, partial [Terriglobia bacterium]
MLTTPWEQRSSKYDFVIIGSGYGGAIAAARLASAALSPKPSVCILERGKEWQPEDFPETLAEVAGSTLSTLNPLGLFELLNYPDISVIKGSGLGGTSLINANVAIKPDPEIFAQFGWPASVTYDALSVYYDRALSVLASAQHPRTLSEH